VTEALNTAITFRQAALAFPAAERHRPLVDAKLYCV